MDVGVRSSQCAHGPRHSADSLSLTDPPIFGGDSCIATWHSGNISAGVSNRTGRPKQLSRKTGISRRMINKMLSHENPPGYGPRLPRYPKLESHIPTIERLLQTTVSSAPATIRDIVECLRREEDFAGSYDSVRNYIRRRAHDDANAWEQAYDLVVRLASDFCREATRQF
jgi:hypothetical protein